tara:strand:+ start:411 stop:962 length:552 start_codon:yes stop_codon:yes gene_type:complete
MTQLIQKIFDMLISINILKIAIKKTKVVLLVQTDNRFLKMAEVSEVAITKTKVVWVVIKVTTTISEVVDLIQEDVEEVVITTIEEEEEDTTIIKEEDSRISFKVEIQEKITKQLNASSSNNQVNANLATSALLHMVTISLDKLLQDKWEDIMVAINNNSMVETKTWINNNSCLLSSTTNTTSK